MRVMSVIIMSDNVVFLPYFLVSGCFINALVSGMCYPMDHVKKVEGMTCYPDMKDEKCIWYDSLEKMGNVYDQVLRVQ